MLTADEDAEFEDAPSSLKLEVQVNFQRLKMKEEMYNWQDINSVQILQEGNGLHEWHDKHAVAC